MRTTSECPKCGGRVLLHIERVKRGKGVALMVATDDDWLSSDGIGTFEAFVCKGCGFTEWYARDVAELKSNERLGVRLIDERRGPKVPYR